MLMPKTIKDRWDFEELVELLEVSEIYNRVQNFQFELHPIITDYSLAIEEGRSREEAEEMSLKAEEEASDELYRNFRNGFDQVLERVKEATGISFVSSKRGVWRAESSDWFASASHIRQIINGVGYFYFPSTSEFRYTCSCSTYRQVVHTHLHHIKWFPEVYGGESFSQTIERFM
jgi:hypothetical protein